MEVLTQEMEDEMRTLDLELDVAKKDMEDEIQRATDEFNKVIQDRIAHWDSKAEYELINAKWQEDSYYRYGLIKLLHAKQASIDAAIADAQTSFKSAMSKIKADAAEFRGEQRE